MSVESREPDDRPENSDAAVDDWRVALAHLQSAMMALDASDGPPEIGAVIDLLSHRLRDAIDALAGQD